MDSYDELKKIDNKNCTCYCFDNIIRVGKIYFDNILISHILIRDLLDDKSDLYKNIKTYIKIS